MIMKSAFVAFEVLEPDSMFFFSAPGVLCARQSVSSPNDPNAAAAQSRPRRVPTGLIP